MIMKKNKITQGGMTSANIIQLSQVRKFNVDISDYIQSVLSAENIDFTRRVRLYDLYEDVMQDTHLESVITKRKARLHSAPIHFVNRDGQIDDRMEEMIRSPWFYSFIDDCIDARFYGFSLFQFDRDKNGFITYQLINRKHVNPIERTILRQQYDTNGLPFDNFYNLLMIGKERDLGILAKATPFVIYKRNALGDWSQFAELFGMPVREYTYDASDDEARQRLLDDAREQGAASVYIHPNDSAMRLIESGGKQASVDVYDRLINRCNAEISKCFLGNTLSTEAGDTGTQALGSVQKEGENDISLADRKYVLDVLNYEMTDLLYNLGIDTRNGEFIYEESEEEDIEKQLRIVQGLWTMGLPMSDDYLYKKFGVDKPEDADNQNTRQAEQPVEEPKEGEPKQMEPSTQKIERETKTENSLWKRLLNPWMRFFV